MVADDGGSPPEEPGGISPDMVSEPTTEALERFAAEAGAEEAVRRLGHEAWLRQRSEEASHLQGLLTDLAERRDPVGVSLSSGDHRNGHIEVVGADFIGLRLGDGGLSLLALTSIAYLRLGTDTDLVGDRPTPVRDTDLHGVLERLLSDQPQVTIVVAGSTATQTGTLERLGQDLAMLRADDGSMLHVPLSSLVEVRLSPGR